VKVQRRGFVTLTAIALFVIVGMAIVAAASLFATEIRRSRAEAADAQLRQLLLAGESMAPQALVDWNGQPQQTFFMILPKELERDDARLSLTAKSIDSGVEVVVDASLGRRHGWQTLRFTKTAGGMKLTSAILNG
jgi:type II secretory pathway pseudopilin PulG